MATNKKSLTLSPTKVDTFLGCRRLFKYKFLAPPFTPPQNRYFLIGNVAHKTLENFHRKQSLDSTPRDWRHLMGIVFKQAAVSNKVFDYIESGLINNGDLRNIKQMLINYIDYLIKQKQFPDVVSVEQLSKIQIGKIGVWLKSDRIDAIGKNRYRVIDYKSGNVPSKQDEINSMQLPSYGILVKQKYGKDAKIEGSYLYLKHLCGNDGVRTYDITEEWMQQAEEMYIKVSEEISRGCLFTQNFSYKYCRICDFKRYCRSDENDHL